MKKEEHLKILKKYESKIKRLEKKISQLTAENSKLQLLSTVSKATADQRAVAINSLMKKNINDIKYMQDYEAKVKDYYIVSSERIQFDDNVFHMLKEYILKNFSDAIAEVKPDTSKDIVDDKLSQTVIGENGKIYAPHHIIEIAIAIMETQKKQLKEILGDDFNSNKNNTED